MASLIQLSDSNATVNIASPYFGQLRTIRDIGGTLSTSNTITVRKIGGSFSDGTSVKTIDTPYATLTVNPSTGRISHAFPFSYNQEVSTISLTNTGSMDISGPIEIVDTLVGNSISTTGFFEASDIRVQSVTPIILPQTISTIRNLGQIYTSSVYIAVDKLQENSYIFKTDLFSTVENLPYVSTYSLESTIDGLATFGYISQSQVTSTVRGVNSNYMNSSNLLSTVKGLGTSEYVSSADFLSTFDEYQGGLIHGEVYTSTVAGLATSGYVSSASLVSSVEGLASFGYISTSWLVSTTISLQDSIQGASASALYTSTAQGLGKSYMSTQNIILLNTGISNSNASILASTVGGLGRIGYISTTQLTSTLNNLGRLQYISTPELTLAVDGTFTASYSNSFASTSEGLASLPFSFISAPHMIDSVTVMNTLQSNSLLSTVAGLGQHYVSTGTFVKTVENLGSAPYSYMSTAYVADTVKSFLIVPYSQPQLTSTVQGLGTIDYISGASLHPTFQNIGGNYISTAYLTTNVPTLPYMKQSDLTTASNTQLASYSNLLNSNLTSTYQNLGSLGYTSTSVNPRTVLISTSIGVANTLAGATYPAPTTETETITGADSNIFKYVNGSVDASPIIKVNATQVITRNLYTTCNLTATEFHGNSYFADGTKLQTSSDRRLKKDIVDMSNALDKINSLTGIYFTRKDDPTHKRNVGFLAQDVERVFPDLVFTDDTANKMKSVKYESIHVAILEAIKELDAEVDSLIQSTISRGPCPTPSW